MLTDDEWQTLELGAKALEAAEIKYHLSRHRTAVLLAGTILSMALEAGSTHDELSADMEKLMELARDYAVAQAEPDNVVPFRRH